MTKLKWIYYISPAIHVLTPLACLLSSSLFHVWVCVCVCKCVRTCTGSTHIITVQHSEEFRVCDKFDSRRLKEMADLLLIDRGGGACKHSRWLIFQKMSILKYGVSGERWRHGDRMGCISKPAEKGCKIEAVSSSSKSGTESALP